MRTNITVGTSSQRESASLQRQNSPGSGDARLVRSTVPSQPRRMASTRRAKSASGTQAAPSASTSDGSSSRRDGRAAGNNPVGQVISGVYGVGGPATIRWGLLKAAVQPPAGSGLSWDEWRQQTEPQRAELRSRFEERLEVISYPERRRRATVGYVALAGVGVAAAAAVATGAPTAARLALGLPLFLGIGFVDSSRCGLCTESLAGAWDVDDTGLEYMPSEGLARRIQARVLKLYARDGAIAAALTALLCRL